jgi:hypothetical protein
MKSSDTSGFERHGRSREASATNGAQGRRRESTRSSQSAHLSPPPQREQAGRDTASTITPFQSASEWMASRVHSVAKHIADYTEGDDEDLSTRYERDFDGAPPSRRRQSSKSMPSYVSSGQWKSQSSAVLEPPSPTQSKLGFCAPSCGACNSTDEASLSAVATVAGKPDLSNDAVYTSMLNEILFRGESLEVPPGTKDFRDGMNRYLTVYLDSRELDKDTFMAAIQFRFKRMTIYPEPFEAPEIRATRNLATMLELQIRASSEPDPQRSVFFSANGDAPTNPPSTPELDNGFIYSGQQNPSNAGPIYAENRAETTSEPMYPSSPQQSQQTVGTGAYQTQYFDSFYHLPSSFSPQQQQHNEHQSSQYGSPTSSPLRPDPYSHSPGESYFRNDPMNYTPPSPLPPSTQGPPVGDPMSYDVAAQHAVNGGEAATFAWRSQTRQHIMDEIMNLSEMLTDVRINPQQRSHYVSRLEELKYDLLLLSNTNTTAESKQKNSGSSKSPRNTSEAVDESETDSSFLFNKKATRRKSLLTEDETSSSESDTELWGNDMAATKSGASNVGEAKRVLSVEQQTPGVVADGKTSANSETETMDEKVIVTPSSALTEATPTKSGKMRSMLKKSKMKQKRPVVVMVRAPATLPAGYTFEARVDGKVMMVKIPKGGVKNGQVFEHTVEAEVQMSIPIGYWRVGLFTSWLHCTSVPMTVNGSIFPHSKFITY